MRKAYKWTPSDCSASLPFLCAMDGTLLLMHTRSDTPFALVYSVDHCSIYSKCVSSNWHPNTRSYACVLLKQTTCKKCSAPVQLYNSVIFTLVAQSFKKCGMGWEDEMTSPFCYQYNDYQTNWYTAKVSCEVQGGVLTYINTRTEQVSLKAPDTLVIVQYEHCV